MLRIVAPAAIVALALTGCVGQIEPPKPAPPTHTFSADRTDWPDPPQIPENFTWSGRYLVPDLGIEVPFTWNGDDGDFQMIAGGEGLPIHFTNVIADGELYTLTYEWPGVPRMPCSHVGAFSLDELNAGFAEASFVGRETLHRESDHEVYHFRSVGVLDLFDLDGVPLRVPIMAGDIYVDVEDPRRLRQLLHFGLQNLYDPNLDEWIVIDELDETAGEVSVPQECKTA